jgi:hypothetical protein
MVDHIVETSDGGFTLQGLTEVSRNVFSVGGASEFVGCRGGLSSALRTGSHTLDLSTIAGPNSADSNSGPIYDTGGFFDFDEDDHSEIVIPADGYYQIAAQARFDFFDSDASFAQAVIASSARDSDWDAYDHARLPTTDTENIDLTVGPITHWMAAGDDIFLNVFADPTGDWRVEGGIQVSYVGSGTNPAA